MMISTSVKSDSDFCVCFGFWGVLEVGVGIKVDK